MKYIKEYNNKGIVDQLIMVITHKLESVKKEISFLYEAYSDGTDHEPIDMWSYVTFDAKDQSESHPFNDIELDFYGTEVDKYSFEDLEIKNLLSEVLTSKMNIKIDVETNRSEKLKYDFRIEEKDKVKTAINFLDKQKGLFGKGEEMKKKYGDQLRVNYRVDENEFSYHFSLSFDFNELYQMFKKMAS